MRLLITAPCRLTLPLTAWVTGIVVLTTVVMLAAVWFVLMRGGLARWTTKAGFHTLLFNFQGIGRSELGGLCFADDVVGAVGWARRRFPGLPVHLLGRVPDVAE